MDMYLVYINFMLPCPAFYSGFSQFQDLILNFDTGFCGFEIWVYIIAIHVNKEHFRKRRWAQEVKELDNYLEFNTHLTCIQAFTEYRLNNELFPLRHSLHGHPWACCGGRWKPLFRVGLSTGFFLLTYFYVIINIITIV